MTRKRDKIKRVASAVFEKTIEDNIFLLSSSVAFHCFLSFIPIIFVLAGLYIILNFNLDWNHLSLARDFVPAEVYGLVENQAQRVNANMSAVNVATVVAFLLSLWLSNNLTKALSQSLNVVFGNVPNRRILYGFGQSVLHTLVIIASLIVLVVGLGFIPLVFSFVEAPFELKAIFAFAQWGLVFLYMIFGLCFAYKYLPNHDTKIPWIKFLPGSFVATAIGSGLAAAFSLYVQNFGSYSRLYGALGVIVIFMIWLRLTFSCALLGGEVNYFFLKYPDLLKKLFPSKTPKG